GTPWARGNCKCISLPRDARNHFYILHEVAHSIVNTFQPDAVHGPWFVGFLIHLTNMYKGIPYKVMEESARANKIRYYRVWRELDGIRPTGRKAKSTRRKSD
ncbi:MAG TPA: hypothetical protein VEP90_01610, partial [Methylomirabilota bacterium]|nr:hypothetical protein [Methylomirabilota bacterium]